MAILNNPDDQDQKQQAGQPVSVSGTAGASSSGGQGVGVGGAAPQSPVSQAQPQTNQGFTDVGTYLDANKEGSAQLGNQVASSLTDQYNTTKAGIDQSAKGAQDAAGKGYVPANTDLIQQISSNPSQLTKDPASLAAAQAQLNSTYTGPANWADRGTQQGKVNDALQSADLAHNPGGLNVLTQQAEGKTGGNQSQGINQLDTLLLGGSPDAMQKVQSAADPFKTLNDYINTQNTAVSSSIGDAQAAADKTRTDAQAALSAKESSFGQDLQGRLQKAAADRGTYNQRLSDLQSKGTPVEQGISGFLNAAKDWNIPDRFQPLLAMNPVTAPPTSESLASPDDFSTAQALSTLSGGSYASPLNQAQAASAGTYKAPGGDIPDYNSTLKQQAIDVLSAEKAHPELFKVGFANPPDILKQGLSANNTLADALGSWDAWDQLFQQYGR